MVRWRLSLLLFVLAAVLGCGGGSDLVPVSGTITFDGGPMPASGRLRFVPLKVDEGFPRRPAIAKFEADGRYRVTSFEPGDGLYPGEYAVKPTCWEVAPVIGQGPGKSYLPPRYLNPGELALPRLTVKAGQSGITHDIDIVP